MSSRLSLLALVVLASSARAGEDERRVFSVFVDQKPVGTHQIIIQARDDGLTTVTSQADVTVRIALITYKFAFRGTEVWKDGILQQLTTSTNDNGRKHTVTAEGTKDGLAVRADGKDFQVKGQPWLTTYWKLPRENQRGPNVTLFDVDTGKLIYAKMDKIGVEKITVFGKLLDCAHYKLTGGVQVNVWYDGADRLVRQESIEEGHRTILELSTLKRE